MAIVRWITAFLDFPPEGFEAGVAFWCAAGRGDRAGAEWRLSAPRGEHDQFATLLPPEGDSYLRVQRLVSAEGWTPGLGSGHIDLHVDDVPAVAGTAERLGARRGSEEPGLVVLESPGGLGLCIVADEGHRRTPEPFLPTARGRGPVDQVCLDIPAAGFEREAGFWAALTGWVRRPGSRPEFDHLDQLDHLVRPGAMPLRVLLQRLDEPAGTRCRVHLDLASGDVESEVARHRALGAEFVRRTPRWVTLTDPAGLAYCITDH